MICRGKRAIISFMFPPAHFLCTRAHVWVKGWGSAGGCHGLEVRDPLSGKRFYR